MDATDNIVRGGAGGWGRGVGGDLSLAIKTVMHANNSASAATAATSATGALLTPRAFPLKDNGTQGLRVRCDQSDRYALAPRE